MKFKLSLLSTLVLSAALAFPAHAADPKPASDAAKPIAKVNGIAIPSSFGDVLASEQAAEGAPNNEALQRAVREELVRREVVAQEARKQGFDKKTNVVVRQDIARQGILIGMYLDDWVKSHPVTDAQVRAEYDKQVKDAGDREYKLRHIQSATEEESAAFIKKLQAGARFEELAKQSNDEGTKDTGGDLGWGRLSSLPFGDSLTKLDKGQFTTTPVKSQFGYHVVLVEDTRKFEPPKFDEIKDRIRQSLQQKTVAEHIGALVKKAKVE